MIVESGVIIFVGLLLLAIKVPAKYSLRALAFPLTIDLSASVLATLVHWGTFSGLMAAAVAGLLTSAFTSIAIKLFGVIRKNQYYPGLLHRKGWFQFKIEDL